MTMTAGVLNSSLSLVANSLYQFLNGLEVLLFRAYNGQVYF